EVAQSLWAGRFATPSPEGGGPGPDPVGSSAATAEPPPSGPAMMSGTAPAESLAAGPAPRAEDRSLGSAAGLGPLAEASAPRHAVRPYACGVARIGAQVAAALDYAAAQGVLHRDIKPSNILLDPQGTAWVTDFGLAKIIEAEDLTGTGDIIGTIRY